jgi:O-acetyl-ADP-ribose deacetylase (regulator of RNase III)
VKIQIKQKILELVRGDITLQDTEAIVNAANTTLLGGGGVDGAIHRRAGEKLLDECYKHPQITPGARCPPGEAKITKGYLLKAKHVIHTVGPVYAGGSNGEPEILQRCYQNSLSLADQYALESIAFPSISTGVFGYPVKKASFVALKTIINFLEKENSLKLVRMILFSEEDFQVYQNTLQDLVKTSIN